MTSNLSWTSVKMICVIFMRKIIYTVGILFDQEESNNIYTVIHFQSDFAF